MSAQYLPQTDGKRAWLQSQFSFHPPLFIRQATLAREPRIIPVAMTDFVGDLPGHGQAFPYQEGTARAIVRVYRSSATALSGYSPEIGIPTPSPIPAEVRCARAR